MRSKDNEQNTATKKREAWERPALRRIEANKAQGGKASTLDDGNQGGGNTGHHS